MKQYKFDYIRETVLKWDKKNITPSTISFTPFYLSAPLILPELIDGKLKTIYIPPKDYYGEIVDDVTEWFEQREEYIKKLIEEFC